MYFSPSKCAISLEQSKIISETMDSSLETSTELVLVAFEDDNGSPRT